MKKQDAKPLNEVLQSVFSEDRFHTKLNETKLMASWPKVVGENVNENTRGLFIKQGKLFVKIASPALKYNLMMQMSTLTKALNAEVGTHVIDTIIFL